MSFFLRVFLVVLFLFSFFFMPYGQNFIYAEDLVIGKDGSIFFRSDKGIVEYWNSTDPDSNVLGSSSGVIITVTASQFEPTSTPIPTYTPTPSPTYTPTPSPTPTSSPSNPSSTATPTPSPTRTPTPTYTPTPTPSGTGNLLVTIQNNSSTVTQNVDQIISEDGDKTLIIAPTKRGDEIVITQGDNEVTTSLPIQIDTEEKSLKTVTNEKVSTVITPDEVFEIVKNAGTYIIPSTIKTELIDSDGKPVYKVAGLERIQIIRLFSVKLPITLYISATDATIVKVDESFITKILLFLHIGRRVLATE